MKRIIDEPCTHKTYKLLKYAKETDSVVVCQNPRAMSKKALAYEITGLDFVSYYDFINTGIGKNKYCIDELENLLNYINCASECTGYTITIGNWSDM